MFRDTDVLESTAMLCRCHSCLGFPVCVLMIRCRLCVFGQNTGSLWTFILSPHCVTSLFYFLTLGRRWPPSVFPSCVHRAAGVGGPVRGVGRGSGCHVCLALEKEWRLMKSHPEGQQEKSQSGGNSALPNWPSSTNCSGSPNRIIQSRSQSDWIKEKKPNSLPPFAFWEFHLGWILHSSYLLHFNYCCLS